MNIKNIFTLAVMAGVFFSGANAADRKKKTRQADDDAQGAPITALNTAADSLSYAAGMVRTDGLIPYLKQSFGVDTAYMADFIRGYKEAMSKGFDERTKAYYAGEQIAQMVSQRMLPFLRDEFAGRPDSVSADMFNRGFVNALKKDYAAMTADAAKTYFDAAFKQAVDERNAANGSITIYDIAQPSDLLGQNECIIGSQVTDNASLVGLCMEAVQSGTFGGEVIYGTMQNGALSAGAVSDLVPAEKQDLYQEYIQQMIDGTFMQ